MGKRKWTMDQRRILGLESNMANVFIQPKNLEKDAKITLVP
jgi:hypothetical protein